MRRGKPQQKSPTEVLPTAPYRTLRRLSRVLRWVGIFAIVLSISVLAFSVFGSAFTVWRQRVDGNFSAGVTEFLAPTLLVLVPVLLGVASGVLLIAISETVKLLIDLADTSRRTAEALEMQLLVQQIEPIEVASTASATEG